MKHKSTHGILTYLIALVWLINGLYCKILNLVPRHGEIVSQILGSAHSRLWTIGIGLAETMMSVWIVTGFRSRLNCYMQMTVIAAMNTLEFLLVPNLLLWGRFNALFAFLFIIVIYYNEFYLRDKTLQPSSRA